MTIYFNGQLTTLNGLGNLATVGGAFNVYYNFKLNNCCAIFNLINGGVSGPIVIFFNKVGCNSVAQINANCAPPPIVGGNNGLIIDLNTAPIREAETVEVFPNPTRGAFKIVVPASFGAGELSIVDITGRYITGLEIVDGQPVYEFENRGLATGVYLIVIKPVGHPTQTIRLVIE